MNDNEFPDCNDESIAYEARHVHEVYNQIASHFSSTRHKPWPIVKQFLTDLPDGSVGLDIGCGNGKYFSVNPNIVVIGSDRSENLVTIANRNSPNTAILADTLSLPHLSSHFDFAISVAVIHHLSTPSRRVEALRTMLATIRHQPAISIDETSSHVRGGSALIVVWALEQKGSRRGWDVADEQDVMVPWVMKQKKTEGSTGDSITFNRYYHLYRRGELEHDIVQAGGTVVDSGYERDNWWAIAVRSLSIASWD